jgi:hypothetical protein
MSLLALVLTFAHNADAAIYSGNPEIVFKVDRAAHDLTAAAVTVDKIRVNYCGGGYTDYSVGHDADLVAGWSIIVSGGDFCGIRAYWTSVISIESDTFGLEYDHAYTDVSVGSTIPPVALAPFTVIWGAIYGGNPELHLTIR